MSNPGAKPASLTVRSIVRHGFSSENRHKLAASDTGTLTALRRAGYDEQTIAACVEYARQMEA